MFLKLKYFYIFLVLNIFLCYSGVCATLSNFSPNENIGTSPCHKIMDADTHSVNSNSDYSSLITSDSFTSSCCLEILLNSSEIKTKIQNTQYLLEVFEEPGDSNTRERSRSSV